MITDYQIALIIITIIGFIISTAFYVYFVYLPAARAEDQIDTIIKQGDQVITLVDQRIIDVEDETTATLISLCENIRGMICTYNRNLIFGVEPCVNGFCVLDSRAYPDFCQQFVPFSDTCNDCPPT